MGTCDELWVTNSTPEMAAPQGKELAFCAPGTHSLAIGVTSITSKGGSSIWLGQISEGISLMVQW